MCGKRYRQTLKRIFSAARPELPLLAGAAVALVVSSATSLIFPKAVGIIVDKIGPAAEPGASQEAKEEARQSIRTMSMGLAGLFLIGAAASFGRVALLKLAGERLVARLRTQTFAALLAKDVAYYDARRSGDMLSRISADTIVLSKAFFECSAAARSAISAVGGAGLLLYISPPLTALSLAVMPVVGVGAVLYGRYVKRLSKSAQTALGDAVGSAGERLASIRTVKLCNGELRCVGIVSSCRVVSCLVLPCLVLPCLVLRWWETEILSYLASEPVLGNTSVALHSKTHRARLVLRREQEAFEKQVNKVYGISVDMALASGINNGMVTLGINCAFLSVLWYGGTLVLAEQLSVGDLAAFSLYSLFVGGSATGLATAYGDLMQAAGAADRVFSLTHPSGTGTVAATASSDPAGSMLSAMTEESRADAAAAAGAGATDGGGGAMLRPAAAASGTSAGPGLRFESVSFAYPTRSDARILHGFDLTVEPGKSCLRTVP